MHVVRHAIVEVNIAIGVLVVHGELLVVVRIVPFFFLDYDAVYRSHCFHKAVSVAIFSVFGGKVFTLPVGDSKLLLPVTEF